MNKRIVSFLLLFIFIFNLLTPYRVFAEDLEDGGSATQTQADFLNFWSGGVSGLSMDNTTSTDYYVLSAFMSNFYNPGSTTLKELIEADASNPGFYQSFSKALGKDSNTDLQAIVQSIGNDTIKGIESGKCTLVDSSGKAITGEGFVEAILSAISKTGIESGSYDYNKGNLKESIVYYQNKSNVAFDFTSPAVRASFQVLCSYNPYLFFSSNGLFSIERMFIDNVGNVWGINDVNGDIKNDNFKGMVSQIGTENIYLILPACLNPSAFSPKVSKSNTDELRMPLMNRFVLGSILCKDDIGTNFQDENIPYYNLLAESSDGYNFLGVFGLHTITPYTMNSGNLFNDGSLEVWKNKNQDLAFFAYNPKFIGISLENSTSGISKFATNSFIVFSPSLYNLKNISGNEIKGTDNYSLDLSELFGTNKAFDIFEGDTLRLSKQRQLLLYLYSGNILTLNQTSMQFFYHSGVASSTDASSQFGEDLYGSEVDEIAAEAGMIGLSLFFSEKGRDNQFEDGEKYRALAPDNIFPSKFVEKIGTFGNNMDSYSGVQNGTESFINSGVQDEKLNHLLKSSILSQKLDLSMFDTNNSETEVLISSDLVAKDGNDYNFFIKPKGFLNVGNSNKDISLGRTSSIKDYALLQKIDSKNNNITNDSAGLEVKINNKKSADALMTIYGYSIFTPSEVVTNELDNVDTNSIEFNLLGSDKKFKPEIPLYSMSNGDFLMGMYFGYIMDMMGFSDLKPAREESSGSVTFRDFSSPFLPKYDISAKGGTLGVDGGSLLSSGVDSSVEDDFEKKQKDLINRIYGLTNDSNNDYRNNLIKNILEGFLLTVHRTITGTWSQDIGSITTGDSSTYQSVTGYIYTPTLEELSFTATLMNNYMKIYIVCMMIIIFLMFLMVLLHMRSWQQGLFITLVMFVALLFPYILISNSINISNKISDSIYSDRFDFWAMTQQQQSLKALNSTVGMNEKDTLLTISNATADRTYTGSTGVKIKWMSPKKVEVFNNLYSDKSLSESFVTNIEIYKWLFNSFIYDSEFVDTDVYGSYLYRPYNSIAAEAKAYYAWGQLLIDNGELEGSGTTSIEGYNFINLPKGYADGLAVYDTVSDDKLYGGKVKHLAGAIRADKSNWGYYISSVSKLPFKLDRLEDLNKISSLDKTGVDAQADIIGLWGSLDEQIFSRMLDEIVTGSTAGIESNLPEIESVNSFKDDADYKDISRAIYLKNTESPFYYFYSVLRMRYDEGSEDASFRKQLLENDMFKISREETENFNYEKNITGEFRDFLDLEGLFTYVIPYLKEGNDYVTRWQKINGSEVEEYNFEYEKDENGNSVLIVPEGEKDATTYQEAAKRKMDMNHVWNMYSPWVDSLYDLDIYNEKVIVGGKKLNIKDTLNPSYYIIEGRPMIFSEADMIAKGYSYKDLTDVERRIQAVLEKTYTDMLYLVNYYDLDNEVLITAAAMYATFHFNEEFSQDSFLGKSVMLYPQCFELKNFNYDAYMRLALLNSTGESVFATDDLYTRVLAKTSIFTGLLLLVCDVIACIAIPMLKFLIIVGLLFLGILICIACVINPPDKIFEAVNKSLLLPTVLFMGLNIGFAWLNSFIVGEGLTAYVGSKSVNFATNDPTVTLLLIALLGGAYLFCAWKVLIFLVDAYRQFGMSTVLAAVGVVGSALAAGTSGVAKRGIKLLGGGVGMGVGALTSEKGNRLAGAYEGARRGTRGILDQRIREQRNRRDLALAGFKSNSGAVTSSIDERASTHKDDITETQETTTIQENSTNQETFKDKADKFSKDAKEKASQLSYDAHIKGKEIARGIGDKVSSFTNADRGENFETPDELYGHYQKGADANVTGLEKAMSRLAYFRVRAEDTWSETKTKATLVGLSFKDSRTKLKGSLNSAYNRTSENVSAGLSKAGSEISRVGGDIKAGIQLTPDYIRSGANEVGRTIREAPGRMRKSLGMGLTAYRDTRDSLKLTLDNRDNQRLMEVADVGKEVNKRARDMDTHIEAEGKRRQEERAQRKTEREETRELRKAEKEYGREQRKAKRSADIEF